METPTTDLNNEELAKAFETLGFNEQAEEIRKACKAKKSEEEEETEEGKEKKEKEGKEEDKEMEKALAEKLAERKVLAQKLIDLDKESENIKKGITTPVENPKTDNLHKSEEVILKAIQDIGNKNTEEAKALGTLVTLQNKEVEVLKGTVNELKEVIEKISTYSSTPKSVQTQNYISNTMLEKAKEEGKTVVVAKTKEGRDAIVKAMQVKSGMKDVIANKEGATINEEWDNATNVFESSGVLSKSHKEELEKSEKIVIV